jgi:Nif-specific regulatory protein
MNENRDQQDLNTSISELRSINRVIDKICRVRETNHIISIIIDELIKLTSASQGVINLLPVDRSEDLVTVIRKGSSDEEKIPYKVHNLIAGWVLNRKTFLKIDDLDSDERFDGLDSDNGRFKAILCFPMIVRGEVIGLTSLVKEEESGSFDDNHCRLAGIIISQSAQILSNALLLEDLAQKNDLLEVSQNRLREDNLRLQAELDSSFAFENIIGKSKIMKDILKLASKVCFNDSPLLITGPTGTGKELMARAIHYNSPRKDKPFVVKNCGIKTESLLEAELFGYVKGAFTGADKNKPGLFKEADGGTVFLDEIGDAPPSTQTAILRVLESGEIRPVGGTGTEFVNVRIVSATNKNPEEEIKKGHFRQDLFYRLNTFNIPLPPLAECRDDIPLLVSHFLGKIKLKLGLENLSVTPAAMEMLSNYSWPGNIRQLENEIERAAVIGESDGLIDVIDLSKDIVTSGAIDSGQKQYKGRLRDITEKIEKDIITATLKENDGNIMKTSKILGLTRKGLKDKISRYEIEFKNND